MSKLSLLRLLDAIGGVWARSVADAFRDPGVLAKGDATLDVEDTGARSKYPVEVAAIKVFVSPAGEG